MIHEFQNFIWVETEKGPGQALLAIDYGPHENMVWIVALEKDGTIKHFTTEQMKLSTNYTFGINLPKP